MYSRYLPLKLSKSKPGAQRSNCHLARRRMKPMGASSGTRRAAAVLSPRKRSTALSSSAQAGYIISSIACKAALYAANNLYFTKESKEKQEMARKWGAKKITLKRCSEMCSTKISGSS
jgi:hypothetical protein